MILMRGSPSWQSELAYSEHFYYALFNLFIFSGFHGAKFLSVRTFPVVANALADSRKLGKQRDYQKRNYVC
jgi:hypothetical protein